MAGGNPTDTVDVFPALRRADYTMFAPSIRLAMEEIETIGYTLIPDFLSAETVKDLSRRADEIYAAQVEDFGLDQLTAIGDLGVCRSPFAYDDAYLTLVEASGVDGLARALLGSVYILHVQRVVISTNAHRHGAAQWHREPSYQNFTSSAPIALTAIYFLDEANGTNDGIYVIDSSQRLEAFPSDEFVRRHERRIDAPSGTLLIFNSALFHRGGVNRSDTPRRSIVQIFSTPLLKQATDIPDGVGQRLRGVSSTLDMLLGYTTQPSKGDRQYRERKLKAIK